MSAVVNSPPSDPSQHYGAAPGSFASSTSSRSLNELRKGSKPAYGQRQQGHPQDTEQYNRPHSEDYIQQQPSQPYPGATHSQRQNSIDSLNFSQMNINDEQRQRRPSKPASVNDVRPPSRTQANGSPYQGQPPARATSSYSNHSGHNQQGPIYDNQSELAYSDVAQQPSQSEYGDFDQNAYASQHEQYGQGYPQQQYYQGEEAYYQQQQTMQQGYADPNASYYDPNTGQYFSYNTQTQQYDFAGPSQQPYYPAQRQGGPPPPGQYGDPYAGQYAQPQGGYQEYAGPGGPHAEIQRASSGGASSFTSSSQHVPPLSRNRTTASTKSGASVAAAAERDRDRSQPITKQAVDDYRNRIKLDADPETQFNFARFLIEAARRLAVATQQGGGLDDAKSVKKYRDALLQEALKLVKRLATQGSGLGKPAYADAQFFLANCLGHGALGLAVDHEKAYNLYVQASKQNHPAATYRTAVCNEVGAGTRRDPARAVLFYRKASALGDTAGMYKLGMILLNGLLGQPKNPREAVTWLKKAAAQADEENPHALHELAALYEKPTEFMQNGQPAPSPVVRDEAQARDLYTQGAQLGHPASQYKLGSCYEYGSLTCPVDPRRSIAWYTRAAEKGHAESELALSGWYLTGSPDVLKQSDSEAYLWARRAANKGLSKAEYAVGYYSEIGIGVKAELEEAKMWYLRAAASGNRRAMQRLSELKKLGNKKGAQGARPTRQQTKDECVIS